MKWLVLAIVATNDNIAGHQWRLNSTAQALIKTLRAHGYLGTEIGFDLDNAYCPVICDERMIKSTFAMGDIDDNTNVLASSPMVVY